MHDLGRCIEIVRTKARRLGRDVARGTNIRAPYIQQGSGKSQADLLAYYQTSLITLGCLQRIMLPTTGYDATMAWIIDVVTLVVKSTITMASTDIIHPVNQEHWVIFDVLHNRSCMK
jgi:hypothetical protein